MGRSMAGETHPRKGVRIALQAEVTVRRAGFPNYRVVIRDLSAEGYKFEFVDRPNVNERVWIKIEGLESLEGTVCWVKGTLAGVKFDHPVHPAVFEMLTGKLRQFSSRFGN